jgi:hypothetical protein
MHMNILKWTPAGEFYGMNPRTGNLELVSRFFAKYPDYADRAFLSVKVGRSLYLYYLGSDVISREG